MKFNNIKAIIFDLDGVITNTSEYHYKAWKRLADDLGIIFNREINEKLRGIPRKESLEIILGDLKIKEEKKQRLMEIKNGYYIDYLKKMTPRDILPGSLELLEETREAGIKIGIGSSSKNAKTVINKLKLEKFIDAISDGYSVVNRKPAPDLFLNCAAKLGVMPEEAIVVEDAESGVEAALNGRFWVIGLGPKNRVGKAHIVFPDLKNIRLGNFINIESLS
ncbi:MAG: beta-phosphoglucomutase [Bacteroidetes bacterium RBG_13_44_24]|nr:MAG: beta-phosphoglucomutase [Actinobacteria bacterium RBG_19FT_COMBO_36_27]OFY44110.1 MAG: beta-phosphoglucomutase [Bacteroidetes bacterium RBG_13_44_24]